MTVEINDSASSRQAMGSIPASLQLIISDYSRTATTPPRWMPKINQP